MPFLIEITAYDPVAASNVSLRLASDDDAAICHLNGQTWWPVIDRLPLLGLDLFGGDYGAVSTPGASLAFAIEPWPLFGRYAFSDARIRIWHGADGAGWGGYTLRFDGRVTSQPQIEDGRAQLSFAVDDKWLDAPLLATYAGTGAIEGPADLKGTPKPLAIGAPMGVPGVLLDSVKSIYQLSGYGQIESIDVPLERLARQFGSPLTDYASYAALDAATVPAGQWATCRAQGLVRMGAPPYGKLCFLMKGDKAGPDGWVRRPGAIIKRIAGLAGGASKVSEAAVDALDTARPYDLSLFIDRQTSARDVIQELAASVNAVAGVSLTGELFVIPLQINAAGLTLRADGDALPIVATVKAVGMAAPWWRLAIGAQPFWDVHGQGDYVQIPEASSQFPAGPPVNPIVGHIHINGTGRKYRFDGQALTFGGEPLTFNGEPILTSGYVDAQDQLTVTAAATADAAQTLANQGLVNAANAQSTANGAQALAAATASNFNARNDRISAAVVVPTIAGDGSAIDHTANPSGTVDVSFEWAWAGSEADIDGFQVLVRNSATGGAYTIGSAPAEESVFTVPATRRAHILFGVDPTRHYSFAVRAFRVVDPDINASGLLLSAWVQPSASGENPYRPSTNVAFTGDISGTINGIVPTRNANRGTWSSASVSYEIGDEVERAGSSYTAIAAHVSTAGNGPPGTNWTLRAAKGTDGADGAPGSPGATGNRFVPIYRRAATLPATPTGDLTPAGWSQTRPAANGEPMWESRAEISGSVTLVGSWSAPVQVEAISPVGVRFDVARSGSFTVSLANSEAIDVNAVSTINAGTGGSSTFTLQLRVRPVGGTYANFGTADSETLPSGDGGALTVSATYTNSSGGPQRYEIEAQLTKTGAGSHAEDAGRSWLRA